MKSAKRDHCSSFCCKLNMMEEDIEKKKILNTEVTVKVHRVCYEINGWEEN